jgi:uncharacterized protein YqeY
VILSERIRADLKTALTARDLVRANVLRMLLAQFKNAEIEKRGPLTVEDCLAQVGKAIKIRREAIEGAQKAGRADLKAKEEAELATLVAYLPAQLSPAELEALAVAAIAEVGAKGPAEMGKAMKVLMPKIAGKADGAAASAMVRRLLSGS